MRYPVHAPVTFSWSVRNGVMRQSKGCAESSSRGGQRKLVDSGSFCSGPSFRTCKHHECLLRLEFVNRRH